MTISSKAHKYTIKPTPKLALEQLTYISPRLVVLTSPTFDGIGERPRPRLLCGMGLSRWCGQASGATTLRCGQIRMQPGDDGGSAAIVVTTTMATATALDHSVNSYTYFYLPTQLPWPPIFSFFLSFSKPTFDGLIRRNLIHSPLTRKLLLNLAQIRNIFCKKILLFL